MFITEKYYNINEVAMMTGLTTRTVRNYLKQGLVSAEKLGGVWKFSPENFAEMLSVPAVKQSVKARNNSVIFDFIANDRKRENKICLCFDLYVDESEAEEISGFFCDRINACGTDDICFNFEKNGRNALTEARSKRQEARGKKLHLGHFYDTKKLLRVASEQCPDRGKKQEARNYILDIFTIQKKLLRLASEQCPDRGKKQEARGKKLHLGHFYDTKKIAPISVGAMP